MVVVVYTSSASGNPAIRNQQKTIIDYLVLHKIEFEEIDLSIHTDAKDVMRSKIPEDIKKENEANRKTVIPPQVFNDDVYCGDYEMFFNAREMQLVHTFFKVCPAPELESVNDHSSLEKDCDERNGKIAENDSLDAEHPLRTDCDVTEQDIDKVDDIESAESEELKENELELAEDNKVLLESSMNEAQPDDDDTGNE